MDRGAWWAIDHGVAKSWTQLRMHTLSVSLVKYKQILSGSHKARSWPYLSFRPPAPLLMVWLSYFLCSPHSPEWPILLPQSLTREQTDPTSRCQLPTQIRNWSEKAERELSKIYPENLELQKVTLRPRQSSKRPEHMARPGGLLFALGLQPWAHVPFLLPCTPVEGSLLRTGSNSHKACPALTTNWEGRYCYYSAEAEQSDFRKVTGEAETRWDSHIVLRALSVGSRLPHPGEGLGTQTTSG